VLRNPIYRQKSASPVAGHLPGEKSGKGFGRKFFIAAKVAEKIKNA
jgi:hypothetical protein